MKKQEFSSARNKLAHPAPSDTDQLFTRSKHTPKKVGDVGNRQQILTPLVARLLDGRGDVLPSISTCKQHDGNGSSYST
jgi:hypothetical protein